MNLNWPLYYHAIATKKVSETKVDKQKSDLNHSCHGNIQDQSNNKVTNQLTIDHDQPKSAQQVNKKRIFKTVHQV